MNTYFDWPNSSSRFVRFDTVRSADANDALDAVSAGFDAVAADMAAAVTALINGTSATSVAIGTGAKSFTASAGRAWAVGQPVRVAVTASPETNWMDGIVTAYNSTTGALSVSVSVVGGSGTYTAWTISISGARGAAGEDMAIASTQRGTLTISNGSTSNTAAITSVDTTKTQLRMLGFSSGSTSSDGAESWAPRIALTNATTITASRSGSTQSLTISWELTEYL